MYRPGDCKRAGDRKLGALLSLMRLRRHSLLRGYSDAEIARLVIEGLVVVDRGCLWPVVSGGADGAFARNTSIAGGIDPNTLLCLHCNGADASTSFPDASQYAHSVSALGNAQVDTAQSKFDGASLLLDGTGDYLSIPDSSDWAFASSDFTIEEWIRFNSIATGQELITQWETTGNQKSWAIQWTTTNLEFLYSTDGAASSTAKSAAWSPSTNTWYHVAAVRFGSVCRLFVDGIQLGTDGSFSGSLFNSSSALLVGSVIPSSPTLSVNGWIDEVRISNVARWTSNFTPPTAAYFAASGVPGASVHSYPLGVQNLGLVGGMIGRT